MYVTYGLYSKKFDRLYVGHSNNIERRFKLHNDGRVPSTRPYRPYELIYSEYFETKADAVKREKDLKTTRGRRFLRSLFIK